MSVLSREDGNLHTDVSQVHPPLEGREHPQGEGVDCQQKVYGLPHEHVNSLEPHLEAAEVVMYAQAALWPSRDRQLLTRTDGLLTTW